jgi:hypothetical protein
MIIFSICLVYFVLALVFLSFTLLISLQICCAMLTIHFRIFSSLETISISSARFFFVGKYVLVGLCFVFYFLLLESQIRDFAAVKFLISQFPPQLFCWRLTYLITFAF